MVPNTGAEAQQPAEQPEVVIVDDDVDMREAFRDLLGLLRRSQCLTASSCEALEELGERALACKVALLDINLGAGKRSGIDAYRWLVQNRFRGRVAFLTGHARRHPLVEEASRLGTVHIITKPAPIEKLLAFIEA
jgi:FixJ family two-component response regulator